MGEFLGAAGLGTLLAGLSGASSAVDAAMQYHYAKKMYQHRYRWAADDMRKAGFNPILAVNGGNVSGMAAPPSTDFSGAVNTGMSAALNFARTRKDIESADVTNDKTKAEERLADANTNNVNARTEWQTIQNGILNQSEKALVEDAQARATNNRALATLNSARAEHAASSAMAENDILLYKMLNEREDLYLRDIKGKLLTRSPEYTMSADERKFLARLKAASGAVNSAAGSFLSGSKAFRIMH